MTTPTDATHIFLIDEAAQKLANLCVELWERDELPPDLYQAWNVVRDYRKGFREAVAPVRRYNGYAAGDSVPAGDRQLLPSGTRVYDPARGNYGTIYEDFTDWDGFMRTVPHDRAIYPIQVLSFP